MSTCVSKKNMTSSYMSLKEIHNFWAIRAAISDVAVVYSFFCLHYVCMIEMEIKKSGLWPLITHILGGVTKQL